LQRDRYDGDIELRDKPKKELESHGDGNVYLDIQPTVSLDQAPHGQETEIRKTLNTPRSRDSRLI